jgi:hypothetical protein
MSAVAQSDCGELHTKCKEILIASRSSHVLNQCIAMSCHHIAFACRRFDIRTSQSNHNWRVRLIIRNVYHIV